VVEIVGYVPKAAWVAGKVEDLGFRFRFRIIFFAISSAVIRSERGMNGLLLQPGREEEGLLCPGLHLVTGWPAISFSNRAASSSRVSPINTRFFGFRPRLNCVFLLKLIITSPGC
jgi:hypothetical protein